MATTQTTTVRAGRTANPRRSLLLVAALTFLCLPVVALAWLPAPYLWILGGWAVFTLVRVHANRRRRRGPVLMCVAAALIACIAVETLYLVKARRRTQAKAPQTSGPALGAGDDVLGYVPNPGVRHNARLELDGKAIFDVHYTIGDDGLRVTPALDEAPTEGSLLFFGCSYMFGHGVEDAETLPYRVATLLTPRFRAHNFAFGGYGAHHMLASIEHGRVTERVREPPRIALYWALSAHIGRSARPKAWDPRGPRYRLQPDGSVRFDGQFDDARTEPDGSLWDRAVTSLRRELRKSYFLRKIVHEHPKTDQDVALWAGIVTDARRRLLERYPGIAFHVLLWDSRGVDWQTMLEQLDARGHTTHRVSQILPGFEDDIHAWLLHRLDLHPSAKAHATLARWVATNLLEGDGR